nr:reverse transcriptase domain-containing protein [Tanacetum cinerariifolium]
MNTASSLGTVSLPSNTIPNPQEDFKAITTRSGVTLAGPSVSPSSSFSYSSSKEVDREPETLTDQVLTKSTNNVPPLVVQPSSASTSFSNSSSCKMPEVTKDTIQSSTKNIQPPMVQTQILIYEPVVAPKPKPTIPYSSRVNKQKLREKDDNLALKFVKIFRNLYFELSFTDALLHIPKFALMFKSLLNNKEKLFDLATTSVNENYSAIILKKLAKKLGDPGKFLIPCDFPEFDERLALADLGASINLMPLSIWKKLSLPELTSIQMILELEDQSTTRPTGIAEDVFVKVGKFHFPTDFVVVDYVVDPHVPLILWRPFLRTRHALIDVYGGELTLRVDDEAITIKVGQTSKYSYNDDESISRVDIIDVACEEYVQEGGDFILEEIKACHTSESIPSGINDTDLDLEGDIRLLKELLNNDPSLSPLPSKELNVEEIKTVKSSINEPPELELKELPSHLEYAYLEVADKIPMIITKDLKVDEKEALLKVLKSHKRAIAWKITDIKGIDPRFYKHKILMEDDFKPTVQSQRRVNPKNHKVIKKEVIKLFDAEMIYPISDSPWVSPIHCLPKKGGITVVENGNNELISTRLPRWENDLGRLGAAPDSLTHGLLTLVQNNQFFGHDKEDPHAHVRYFNKITSTLKFSSVPNTSIKLMLFPFSLEGAAWIWMEKEPPRSIFTWDDRVSKFINQFFPLSKTTNLRNEITNFQHRFDESFSEAWDRFKDLLRACPHHGIIESKSKVSYSRNKPVVAKVSMTASTSGVSPDVAELKDMVRALLLDKKRNCLATDGNNYRDNIQEFVSQASAVNFNQENTGYRPPMMSNQIRPPGVSKEDFSAYVKANDAVMRNMQTQGQNMHNQLTNLTDLITKFMNSNTASTSSSGTLPSNTITNPKSDLKAITTRSGVSYDGPQIPLLPSSLPKVVEDKQEVTKDTVDPTNNGNTKDVQPQAVHSKPVTSLISEPAIALVSAQRPNPKASIPYPSRRNDERNREKAKDQIEKFYQIFKDMSFEISFADALILMPKFASTLKALIGNKEKLSEMARTPLNEHCSVVLLKNFDADPRIPIILERSFLKTKRAPMDVFKGELTLRVGKEAITFNLDQTSRYSANYSDMTAKRIDVIDMACKEYS